MAKGSSLKDDKQRKRALNRERAVKVATTPGASKKAPNKRGGGS